MTARTNVFLLVAAAAIVAAPLAMTLPGDFAGTDSRAQAMIEQSGYRPWFSGLWAPPSPEIESLLFAAQAALGAGVLGYVLGRRHGRRKERR